MVWIQPSRRQTVAGVNWVCGLLFTGILLTGLGSGYYHWLPDNDRPIWARIPMTIVFALLLAATVAEWVDRRAGLGLLVPLVSLGFGSVLWWHYTEQKGNGDLRFYGWVQFFPMLCLPLILVLFGRSGGYKVLAARFGRLVKQLLFQCCQQTIKTINLSEGGIKLRWQNDQNSAILNFTYGQEQKPKKRRLDDSGSTRTYC